MKRRKITVPRMPKGWTWIGSNLDIYGKNDKYEVYKKEERNRNLIRNTKLDKTNELLAKDSKEAYNKKIAAKEATEQAIKEGRYTPPKKKYRKKKSS